jgi:hypothetical protein
MVLDVNGNESPACNQTQTSSLKEGQINLIRAQLIEAATKPVDHGQLRNAASVIDADIADIDRLLARTAR